MKVLIPLLSRNELNEEFLEKALKGAHEIVLLMVIDKEDSPKASDISSSTHFMDEVKKAVGKKRKRCEEFTEWGETPTKIKNTAILNKVDKIVLLKQENQYFENLVEKLSQEKEIKNKIEVIKAELIQESTEKNPEEQKTKTEQKTEHKWKAIKEEKKESGLKDLAEEIRKKGFYAFGEIKKASAETVKKIKQEIEKK
jgi:hypothetical protein